jgi:hypothetical protein
MPSINKAERTKPLELGPLFFTASERAELERIRAGIASSDDPTHASRTMQLDGMMQKNGEAAVIWINGERYKGREIAGAKLSQSALNASTIIVHLPPPDARDMVLKVGQTIDPAGGNLREVYQRPPQELNQLLQLLSKRGSLPQTKEGKAPLDNAAIRERLKGKDAP